MSASSAVWDPREVERLYEQGLYMQAWRLGTSAVPLREWPGTEGLVLAGRLAANIGAPRLAHALHLRAWRRDPSHPQAHLYYATGLLHRFGPLAALEFMGAQKDHANHGAVVRSSLAALRAGALAMFRDFERADEALREAEALAPADPWIHVNRSHFLELADAYDEAMAANSRALELQPWFRPAVQQRAHLLQLLHRTEDAILHLGEALEHIESSSVAGMLVFLLHERERWQEAAAALDRFEELSPIAEPQLRRWIAAMRSNLAYQRGDEATALELARLVETRFHRHVERVLARPPTAARKLLPVEFVRQHHMTCGPATLTALCRWFGHEADHLEVAERICYGGTSAYSERHWAEERGFVVREFTLTERNARTLIDRELPFGVATYGATSGHMQAVIGYDDRRDVLLVRDPYQPFVNEWSVAEFFEHYRATGPRAMLMIPRERAGAHADIELEDESLFDALYRVEAALESHDHDRAYRELHALIDLHPDHLLGLVARRAICAYEQDMLGLLSVANRLCDLYPANERYLLMKLGALGEFGRREERIALLEEAVRRPLSDPVFALTLAQELMTDGRAHAEAERHLRAALRRAQLSRQGMWLSSRLALERGDTTRALEHARFAACLEETDERLAANYFALCHAEGRVDEALRFLRQRFARFARRSSLPAQGLFAALERMGHAVEGFTVLDQALEARPTDAGLALFAAAAHARYGRITRARELMERAQPSANRRSSLRVQAEIEVCAGDMARSLACWREVLELEPLDPGAWSAFIQLIEATEGPGKKLAELHALAGSYPFHAPIQRLCIQALGAEHPAETVELLERLLERHPEDGSARRELALRFAELGRGDEALATAEMACELEPRESAAHAVRGVVLERSGRLRESLAALRHAVELDADTPGAIAQMITIAGELDEGPAALEFARAELGRQAMNGMGIVAWVNAARGRVDAERVLTTLRGWREQRPELWIMHWVLAQELLSKGLPAEASPVIEAATARFPLQTALWLLRGTAQEMLGDPAGQRASAEQACAVGPTSSDALHMLARCHLCDGNHEPACELLERAATVSPLNLACHHLLITTLLAADRNEDAMRCAERMLHLLPREGGAWELHLAVARALGQGERTLDLARNAVKERSGDARHWLILAQMLDAPGQEVERETSLARALEIDPSLFRAADMLAEHLTLHGRPQEALAALERCRPERAEKVFADGRRAWILSQTERREEALAEFESLVRTHPHYLWARAHLVELCRQMDRKEAYYDAARGLADLAPDEARSQVYLGHAALLLERKEEAESCMKRALALDPSQGFAGEQILRLQLDAGRLEDARQTFERVHALLEPDDRALLNMRLVCAEGNREAASALLREKCRDPEVSAHGLWYVAGEMDARGLLKEALGVLDEAVVREDSCPHVGSVWMERFTRNKAWDQALERFLSLPARVPAAPSSAHHLLERAYDADEWSIVRRLVAEREALLREDPECWGEVARHLLAVSDFKTVVHWCRDWKRNDARPWMLLNLASALWSWGDLDGASEVSRHACTLESDHTTALHEVWLAAARIVEQDLTRAHPHHVRASSMQRGEYYEHLFKMIAVALDMDAAPDPKAFFPRARRRIDALSAAKRSRRTAPVGRVHLACVRAIARKRGGVRATLWAFWQRMRTR